MADARTAQARSILTIAAGVAAIAGGLLGPASAQTVQNGSFSTNSGGFSTSFVPTTSNLTNWTVSTTSTNPFPCVVYGNSFSACGYTPVTTVGLGTDPGNAPYFGAGSWSGTNPIISQTIGGLTTGKQYVISFYQAMIEDNSVADTAFWSVTFGGSTLHSTTMNIPAGGVVGWASQAQSLIFTATAVSQTLSFLAAGGSSSAPPLALLDGVQISQVPEPASLALLGCGVVGLVGVRRRRARSVA